MPIILCVAAGVAFAGSQGSMTFNTWPLFGLAVALAFIVNWLVFIPAFALQTEHFFDLTGSLTYITVTALIFFLSPVRDLRSILIMIFLMIWALRLGTFLFTRIQKSGKDGRFDELKPSFIRFFLTWSLQGMWVSLTASAAWIAISSENQKDFDLFAAVGAAVWILGFTLELVADFQKSRFNADPANRGKFISTGLWSRSRHPNYFGEITLWLGITIMAIPTFQGWQWVALISPLFVFLLLTRVSGVNMLEDRADKKWGGEADYEAYKARTPVLFPSIKKR